MNKRIQKKVAKQQAQAEQAFADVQSGVTSVPEALRALGQSTEHLVRSLAHEVQQRADQALNEVKEKVAATEQRAEALLHKVPGVGDVAAQKLHDLTRT